MEDHGCDNFSLEYLIIDKHKKQLYFFSSLAFIPNPNKIYHNKSQRIYSN